MEYELVWTEPASKQLKEAHDYIAERNPGAATKIVGKIMADVEHPIRKIVSGKYRIFYRIVEQARRQAANRLARSAETR